VASFTTLPPGGWLLDHDTHINADKQGPLPIAECSVLLMHSTPGKCWSTAELADMAQRVGYVDITPQTNPLRPQRLVRPQTSLTRPSVHEAAIWINHRTPPPPKDTPRASTTTDNSSAAGSTVTRPNPSRPEQDPCSALALGDNVTTKLGTGHGDRISAVADQPSAEFPVCEYGRHVDRNLVRQYVRRVGGGP
jgi:hypothetical protein